MPFALEIRGLWKRYVAGAGSSTGTVDALRDVNFAVSRGEVVGVVGAAGAGKTTLLLCAAGLLRPSAGTVTWFGASRHSALLRHGLPPRHVAHVQVPAPEVASSGGDFTVRDWLERAARRGGRLTRERRRAVDDGLMASALADHADAHAATLPPGAWRRVALARALLDRPALLLVDDLLPACAASSRAGPRECGDGAEGAVARCLHRLAERGTAVVVAAEEPGSAARVAPRIAVLRAGRLGASPAYGMASGAGEGPSTAPRRGGRVRVAEGARGSESVSAAGRPLR